MTGRVKLFMKLYKMSKVVLSLYPRRWAKFLLALRKRKKGREKEKEVRLYAPKGFA